MNILVSTLLSLGKKQAKALFRTPILPTPSNLNRVIDEALAQRFGLEPGDTQEPVTALADIEKFLNSFDYQVVVPGRHYSGLSNQKVFDLFAEHGRDFGAYTNELKDELVKELLREMAGEPWDFNTAVDVAARVIRKRIIERVAGSVSDVPLSPLSADWVAKKRQKGWYSRVGAARGKFQASLGKARILIS